MSQDDLLSQEEIDALLKGVSGDNEATPSPAATSLRRYDPATQHRVVRDRLHTLDIINERFARQFRMGLFNLMRRTVDITVDSVRYLSYSEFSRNVPVPANINMLALKPLRGSALMVFPPSLVFMVVDNLFGGDGRFLAKSEGREFTNTEQRIIQRILALAIEAYGEAWKAVYPLEISYLRSEMQSRFANITNSPNEIVVNTVFNIEVGNLSSSFNICMPYTMITPLRDLLTNPLNDARTGDGNWRQRLAGELRHSQVEVVAEFATLSSHIAQVLGLKAGDVLPLELPETIIAKVDGVPVMECEYGRQRDQRALRVRRLIDHVPDGPQAGPLAGLAASKPKESQA
ncbi:flagellar motor switch protein FliM [Thauera chlorobenzoica]|uniref:Flagellar motor switch protein FliM n=1 Tax=Thauera chlorobenzoica TaxID=96773 RepID=A0A1H5WA64_9RHOO|nr:flagellar motor switch protein FliM [Thauera chlorobenzoica]APR03245.1 Flagellar motor switch protein FliM [Thauera chlorobenzoica]SEF96091.1 flagellar motor switch protein FliM [Thauera chlorobenzoica]